MSLESIGSSLQALHIKLVNRPFFLPNRASHRLEQPDKKQKKITGTPTHTRRHLLLMYFLNHEGMLETKFFSFITYKLQCRKLLDISTASYMNDETKIFYNRLHHSKIVHHLLITPRRFNATDKLINRLQRFHIFYLLKLEY